MFNVFGWMKGRGGLASLIVFAAALAGWVALHAFGPDSHSAPSAMVFLAATIVAGVFAFGAVLALGHILLKAAWRRIPK